MLVGHGVEVVHDREARRVRRSRPGVLIRNLRRGAHRHSGGGEESRRRPLPKGVVIHGICNAGSSLRNRATSSRNLRRKTTVASPRWDAGTASGEPVFMV